MREGGRKSDREEWRETASLKRHATAYQKSNLLLLSMDDLACNAVRAKWITTIPRNGVKIYPFLLEINSLANTINADEDQKKWHGKLNSFV